MPGHTFRCNSQSRILHHLVPENFAMASNKPITYDLTTFLDDEECPVVRSPTMRKAEKRGKLNAPAAASASPELRRRKTSAEPNPDNTRVEDSSWLSDEETAAAADVIAEAPAQDSKSVVLVTPKEKRKAPMVAPGAPQRKKLKAPSAKPASGVR